VRVYAVIPSIPAFSSATHREEEEEEEDEGRDQRETK